MPQNITELRRREVINIRTGFRLGFVCDVLFDVESGKIASLTIPAPTRFFGLFGRHEDFSIPWDSVVCIGDDVILIDCAQ